MDPLEQARELYADGRLLEAATLLREFLRANPSSGDGLQLLGTIRFQTGSREQGKKLIEHAVTVDPRNGAAWNSLGLVFHLSGEDESALGAFAQATKVSPGYGEAWMNQGFVLQELGRQEASIELFRRSIGTGFRDPKVFFFLGNAYSALGRHDEAISQFDEAISAAPEFADAWNNRSISLNAQGRLEEAAESMDRAIQLIQDQVDREEAREPTSPEALSRRTLLVRALESQGRWGEAIDRLKTAQDVGQRFLHALLMPAVFESSQMAADALRHLQQEVRRLREERLHLEDPLRQVGVTAFHLPYFGVSERPYQVAIADLYREAAPSLRFEASHSPGRRRPRIGVISALLKKHSVALVFGGLMERLDRERFEVIYFQIGASDYYSERLVRSVDRLVRVPYNLAEARLAVAHEELDLLFYPEVGTDPLTYYLAFSRLAPVQAATWGHPLTSGSPTMDYFLSSEHLEREDGHVEYSEDLVRLPSLGAYYERPAAPTQWSRSDLGLPEDRRLYGCPQTAHKFHPNFDPVLATILERDERGSLVLIEPDRPNLKRLLIERWRHSHPVFAERAIWLRQLPLDRYLRMLQLCDALLAPIQFGAGRSALDALGVGVPVVTFKGPYLKSRIAYAAYKEIAFEDLIAETEEQYADLAGRMANDREWQVEMRRQVGLRSEPLFCSGKAVSELNRFLGRIVGPG